MTVGLQPRLAALNAIRDVDGGAWSTRAVPEALSTLQDPRDRALAAHLAHGTIRWRGTLDWVLGQALTRPLEDVEESLARVLRLGVFQLRHSRVPARAAVDTCVELARRSVPAGRAKGAAGFVNGVLRGVDRRADEIDATRRGLGEVSRLALDTGHPDWIVEERLAAGDDMAAAGTLLHADNDPPGLTLRATGDRDALVGELRAQGLDATPTSLASEGVRVPGADPRQLEAVAEGRAVPQDEASMLVVEAVAAQPGERIIDLCAAPGGKAIALAAAVGPTGTVTAVDVHAHRARMVTSAAARVGVEVDVVVGDATQVALPTQVDAVLVDAPCTGLGVGRRRPEIRWRRSPDDVAALASLQQDLLATAIGCVRPGGRVTYSVCTWTAAETTGVVTRVGALGGRTVTPAGSRQLRPDVDGTDGMYHHTWTVV